MPATQVIEPIKGIVVGSFGQTIILTVVNDLGVAQDVSGYTLIQAIASSPDRRQAVTRTAAYTVAGADGKVQFSFASGNIDRPGTWDVQILFFNNAVATDATEVAKTYSTTMEVGRALVV